MGIKEKEFCYVRFPKISTFLAKVVLFLNIFLPGFGTMIVGFLGDNNLREKLSFIGLGIIFFFTSFIIVGWVLAFSFSLELNIYATELTQKTYKSPNLLKREVFEHAKKKKKNQKYIELSKTESNSRNNTQV